MKNKPTNGNMAEYLLPTVLVGFVAVGGLTWAIQGSFSQQGAIGLFQGNQVLTASGGKSVIETRQFGQSPLLQSFEYTSESGKVIRIPNFPTDLAAVVEVDGTQGTTEKLLAAYEQWIDALVKAGEITPEQGNLMKTLSTQGHHMANQQGVLEKGIASCGESKRCVYDLLNNLDQNEKETQNGGMSFRDAYFQNIPIPSNSDGHMQLNATLPQKNQARKLTPNQHRLISEFGIIQSQVERDPTYNNSLKNMRVGKSLQDFVVTYETVLSQVPLSVQNQKLMTYFSGSIFNLTLATTSVTNSAFSETSPFQLREWNQAIVMGMQGHEQKNRSDLMHVHAGGICQLADGQDSRQGCQ